LTQGAAASLLFPGLRLLNLRNSFAPSASLFTQAVLSKLLVSYALRLPSLVAAVDPSHFNPELTAIVSAAVFPHMEGPGTFNPISPSALAGDLAFICGTSDSSTGFQTLSRRIARLLSSELVPPLPQCETFDVSEVNVVHVLPLESLVDWCKVERRRAGLPTCDIDHIARPSTEQAVIEALCPSTSIIAEHQDVTEGSTSGEA
jgi:hypothetical protein